MPPTSPPGCAMSRWCPSAADGTICKKIIPKRSVAQSRDGSRALKRRPGVTTFRRLDPAPKKDDMPIASSISWTEDLARIDWDELSALYRAAPLGDKSAADLKLVFT